MLILGDVVAIVAILFGICISLWASMVVVPIVFSAKVEVAGNRIEARPWKTLLFGLAIAAIAGSLAVALAAQPNALARLIGWFALLTLLAVAGVGAGGLTGIVARRMLSLDANLSSYAALGKAAGLIVVAMLVPVFGWFFLSAIVLCVSLGAGFVALRTKTAPMADEPPVAATVMVGAGR